ncbi:MAG: NifB/NifX family molybdenum-iron cluster-binding protein [Sphaerochaeta sp.]|jgi:predicted Fe-Mo cluster-binding NifX family protein|nr:NifB/NifX family molybdenum-iron cluster-binding protein [Sphaerochaeta sp.]
MIIAVPAENQSLDSPICQSFGRAPFFCIYDTGSESSRFLDNTAKEASGGAGIEAAQLLVDQNIDALITYRLGENAARVFRAANTKLLKAVNLSIADNVANFLEEKLASLEDIHSGYHHG